MPVVATVTEKRCYSCGETKKPDEFYRNSHTKTGLSSACKPCHSALVKRTKALTASGVTHIEITCATCGKLFLRERKRGGKILFCSDECSWSKAERHRFYNWGFTPRTFAKEIAKQEGCCAACGVAFDDGELPYVDHDHTDGHIRGLIHRNCNSALGLAMDSPARLIALAMYLLKDAIKPGID